MGVISRRQEGMEGAVVARMRGPESLPLVQIATVHYQPGSA